MTETKVIPYHLIKQIIEDCKDDRTKALLAFQYAMGNRAGELAREYDHKKHKWKKRLKKMVLVKEFKTQGIMRDQFFETEDGLEWESPNFKNTRQPTKRAWILKNTEEWLYTILKAWLDKKKEAKNLFGIKHSRIKGLIDEELKKYSNEWSSHCLRHSRATHIGDAMEDPYVVKAILGHARIETSTRYVSITKARMKAKMAGKKFEDVLGVKV